MTRKSIGNFDPSTLFLLGKLLNYKFINMKLLKTLVVVALIAVNSTSALAYTEITSAPEAVLSNSTLDSGNGCISLTKAWDIDMSGDEVSKLTEYLKKEGFFNGRITKDFNRDVKRAVAKFQLEEGIIKNEDSEVLGVVTASTREFISKATCAKLEVKATNQTTKKAGYSISLSTRSGVEISENDSEIILRGSIIPQEKNARIEELTLQFDSIDGVNPNQYIEAVELYTKGKLISRVRGNSIWTNITSKNRSVKSYLVTLGGSRNILSTDEEIDINVRVLPKPSALSLTPRNFEVFVPKNGLSVEFSDLNGSVKESKTWGRENQKSSFEIGRIVKVIRPVIPAPPTPPTATTTATTTPTTLTLLPLLNRITPDEGGFSQDVELRGLRFHPTNNKVKIVHSETNSKRISGNLPSINNTIQYRIPGIGAEFTRKDNGRKVSGQTGGYRVSVISDGKESNWIRYLVKRSSNPNERPVEPYVPLPRPVDPVPAPTQVPELNILSPNDGPFGTEFRLRATYLTPGQTNRIKLVHAETGATRTFGPFASSNSWISYRFPGKNTEFTRSNGSKISGKAGTYRVYVITANGESNWLPFRVTE